MTTKAKEVTVSEFRERLKHYLEGGEPVLITRRGREPLGLFIPLLSREEREKAWQRLEARLKALDRWLMDHGIHFTEAELEEVEEPAER